MPFATRLPNGATECCGESGHLIVEREKVAVLFTFHERYFLSFVKNIGKCYRSSFHFRFHFAYNSCLEDVES